MAPDPFAKDLRAEWKQVVGAIRRILSRMAFARPSRSGMSYMSNRPSEGVLHELLDAKVVFAE